MDRPEPPRRYRPSTDRPAVLDLGARWVDVRRISRRLPEYQACLDAGWERDDLDAELLMRVIARQRDGLASRYNPARSSVGKYLHVLCKGLLLHALQAQTSRSARCEQPGMGMLVADSARQIDASGRMGLRTVVDAAVAAVGTLDLVDHEARVVRLAAEEIGDDAAALLRGDLLLRDVDESLAMRVRAWLQARTGSVQRIL